MTTDRIPESTLLKLAAAMLHLYEGEFVCKCRQSCHKTEMYCRNCGYKATMMERLRRSEQIKYNNILSEMDEY